jgi:hypothetical protein
MARRRRQQLASELNKLSREANKLMKRIAAEFIDIDDPATADLLRLQTGDLSLNELIAIFERSDQMIAKALNEASPEDRERMQSLADQDKEMIDRIRRRIEKRAA